MMNFRINLGTAARIVLAAAVFHFGVAVAAAQSGRTSAKTPAKAPAAKPAPANLPKVTQVDAVQLKSVLTPNGRPLLVNFWATWCDPCRDEFPDLVRISADYKGRADIVTVSLDDPAEIGRDVPMFLSEMKAEMPAFLLNTPDEDTVINSVSLEWQGALPFTIIYDAKGATFYTKKGKFKADVLRGELDKVLAPTPAPVTVP